MMKIIVFFTISFFNIRTLILRNIFDDDYKLNVCDVVIIMGS